MKYLIALMAVVFAVAAQVMLKYAQLSSSFSKKWMIYIALSITSYAIAFIFQLFIYKFFPLSKIAPTLSNAIVLLVIISGVCFFNETLQTKQMLGIILGIASIYLIIS